MKSTKKPAARKAATAKKEKVQKPNPLDKELEFVGSSLDDLRNFPADARQEVGLELRRVQYGLLPRDGKPMKTVGSGAIEIRVNVQGQWRVVYVAKFSGVVHVLHAFQKTTPKTSQADIDLAKKRYKEASKN